MVSAGPPPTTAASPNPAANRASLGSHLLQFPFKNLMLRIDELDENMPQNSAD
jgi:hypothetical protein